MYSGRGQLTATVPSFTAMRDALHGRETGRGRRMINNSTLAQTERLECGDTRQVSRAQAVEKQVPVSTCSKTSVGNQVIKASICLSRIHGRETSSSDFWWDRVVEEARRPLKSANPHNLGQDLHMPVEVLFDRIPISCSRSKEWSVLER